MKLSSLLRGLLLLTKPSLIGGLRELETAWRQIEAVRSAYPHLIIHIDALIQGWKPERMTVGRGVRIEKGTVVALGDEFNGFGRLDIGDTTWIGQYNNLRLGGNSRICIGRGCLVSQFCTLVAANHQVGRDLAIREQTTDTAKVDIDIGDDVWLGAGTSVMPAVVIGNGAVVGAGSVVTVSIPAYEIWAGVPARKIGERK